MLSELEENYSRSEYVYLTNLYLKAKKFDKMIIFIEHFIKKDNDLSKQEINLIEESYKAYFTNEYNSWKLLKNKTNQEKNKDSSEYIYSLQVLNKIEESMNNICFNLLDLIDRYLIKDKSSSNFSENKVHYLKLEGDFYKYKISFAKDEEDKLIFTDNCEKSYLKAYELACKNLMFYDKLRILTIIDLSNFYYYIVGKKEKAMKLVKSCYVENYENIFRLSLNEKEDEIEVFDLIEKLKHLIIFWENELI